MCAEITMPILNRQSRNLSPLEEDTAGRNGCLCQRSARSMSDGEIKRAVSTTTVGGERVEGDLHSTIGGGEGGRTLASAIGSAILTARSSHVCENQTPLQTPLQGDCPRGVNGEGLDALATDIQVLWRQRLALGIEVRGQANGDKSKSSLLLEKWTLRVTAKRPTSPAPPTSPKLLLQAVHSYLHFSQIRSWQEVGVADHTPSSFQLVYKVCGADSSHPSLLLHTFPPLPIAPHAVFQVSVASLPRLPRIPKQLSPGSTGPSYSTPTVPAENATPTVTRAGSSRDNAMPTLCPRPLQSVKSSWPTDPSPFHGPGSHSPKEGFPFSPPLPSPLSPKLLMGLADSTTFDPPRADSVERTLQELSLDPDTAGLNSDPRPVDPSDRGGVVPPAACSPAPFSRLHTARGKGGAKRRSCAIPFKRLPSKAPPQRSNSAPVFIPSLCLLGTFEESVLNGRLEPCGHVEGFTAELGASGAFCPTHVVLPVNAAFYNLHDNYGGTSPYLGQVELCGVGKRGYQVPRKGTVQVTLFNPNHTVVKIYIVTYDFSDMPPRTQTFLRQKTLSHPTHPSGQGATPTSYLPALHYLIHLRFLCSKSKRVYLHRDIRLIFARRAPDTDPDNSKVALYTSTEGPSEPMYSPC